MKKSINIFLYIASCIFFFSTISCTDDILLDNGVMDGNLREIPVTVCFEPNNEANLTSRSASGTSIQDINSLRMLVYNSDGKILYDYPIWKDGSSAGVSDNVSNEKYDSGYDNRYESEKETLQDNASGKLTYSLKIPTGKYYIYAIANTDDLKPSEYDTREKLKAIKRVWNNDPEKMSENSEMFGVYDTKDNRSAYITDTPIDITNSTSTLHCWLRRLASKVTVAFDGTKLYDNVQIYIESVAIKDIPKICTLGNPNVAGLKDVAIEDSRFEESEMYSVENGLYQDGDTILYQDVHKDNLQITPENYLHVCNSAHAYFGIGNDGNNPDKITNFHKHTAKSLFFYENMQGKGKDKRQDYTGPDGKPDGKLDHPGLSTNDKDYKWKDDKIFGTYIEVKGWYRCISPDKHVSEGDITYRFMLGKDVLTDYNAERNTHYKLTLCFKGYGNDADWHIEYEEDRNIQIATPQYISYLYNKKMMANIKINGKLPEGAKLHAQIVDNETTWKPWGDDSPAFPKPSPDFYSSATAVYDDGPWNTFLSLRQTKVIKIEDPARVNAPSNTYPLEVPYLSDLNKNYFKQNRIGEREYETFPREQGYEGNSINEDGMYFVQALTGEGNNATSRLFSIPLYTRAKELVTRTGFTGNNPYTAYPRKGKIKFWVTDKSGNILTDFKEVYLDIIQVRRVINPKGVWRKAGSTSPFHVTLMRLPEDNAPKFVKFNSEGKWSAEVISEPGKTPITLSTTPEGSGIDNIPQSNVSRIDGETEHPIDFTINFNGTEGCAIVRIRYHNYTCEHDIFCRNGYETPIALTDDAPIKWPSYNISHFEGDKAVYTKSPLEEGGLFRRGNTSAILAENSLSVADGGNEFGTFNVTPSELKILDSTGNTSNAKWNDIKQSIPITGKETFHKQYHEVWKTITNDEGKEVSKLDHIEYIDKSYDYHDWIIKTDNPNERIARGTDFYTMISEKANSIDFPINKAYGVLYGEGAEKTQEDVAKAYHYIYTDGRDSECGMRGVFVYNRLNCRQVFFPVGASGYGHRNSTGDGVLRYAGRAGKMDVYLNIWPLFYDLYRRPGAIYWNERYYPIMPREENKTWVQVNRSSAFDINFYTMGFEGYGDNDAMASTKKISHACFIRTVIPK